MGGQYVICNEYFCPKTALKAYLLLCGQMTLSRLISTGLPSHTHIEQVTSTF